MKKILFGLLAVSFISFLTLTPVLAAGPAALGLSPDSGSYRVGETFNLTITVNPNGETIDTVRAKISYPAEKLEIHNFSFGPIFSYQTGGNGYDNLTGTFSFGAGVANGTTAASTFGTIVFKVKSAGQAPVILAADSLVLSAGESKFDGQAASAVFQLSSPAPVPAPTPAPTPSPKPKTTAPAPKTQVSPPVSEQATSSPDSLATTTNEVEVLPQSEENQRALGFAAILSGWNLAVLIALAVLAAAFIWFLIKRFKKGGRSSNY